MHPILLKLGPATIYSYGAMLVAAFLIATRLAVLAASRLPPGVGAMSPEQTLDMSCWSLLGGIVGGRLFYVALQPDLFLQTPLEVVALWHGGLVWYGGFLGGVFAAWLYARSQRLQALAALEQLIPFVALGHAIGRVGCFLNGCCYGRPTQTWCGVVFPGHDTPVLPTQLFETLGLLIIYAALRILQQRSTGSRSPGRILGWYLVSYAVLRFFLEFLRGDQTAWWLGLTLQQTISIGLFFGGTLLLQRWVRVKA